MPRPTRLFKTEQPTDRLIRFGDVVVLAGVALFLYTGTRLAFGSPAVIKGPVINLSPAALPWYTAISLGRMILAYGLSLAFTIVYGRAAASNRNAEQYMIPLLDVLQSVPILSFLPVVLLGLSAILPENLAAELASIVLIFTSMAWNLTFSWYQSLTSLPKELREASRIFRLNPWLRLTRLELPFAAIGLVWNSVMSWAGGWFFLMAAEIFTVGNRNFQLPGLGAYLYQAAYQLDYRAIAWGLFALVLVVVLLDQLVWRPLLAWSERFKIEMVESDQPSQSWFYDLLQHARLVNWLEKSIFQPLRERTERLTLLRFPAREISSRMNTRNSRRTFLLSGVLIILVSYAVYLAGGMLLQVNLEEWKLIGASLAATGLRVLVALLIGVLWTVPVGVLIGTNQRLAAFLQPLVQIIASIPATALFPVMLLFLLNLSYGLNLAAVFLMLLGTQWYLLFNIIAGANAIPQDLKYTSRLMHLSGWMHWRTLILPALYPFLVTGAITASGGAWNASIVAEHVIIRGRMYDVLGIGATIAEATARGDYPLLLAATLSMILVVVLINRFVWRSLYRLAADKYRLE
jgi:NitT/TauT family transport system permease protein